MAAGWLWGGCELAAGWLWDNCEAAVRRMQSLRLVFHGTSEANVEGICREGLDPKRRSGQAYGPGEYFGGDAAVSWSYCRGGKKMIVFVRSSFEPY